MVREKFVVRLTPEERIQLEHMVRAGKSPGREESGQGRVRAGKSPGRVTTRARILLKTGEGWTAPRVAQALYVAEGTVFRIKRRFAEDGVGGSTERPPPV